MDGFLRERARNRRAPTTLWLFAAVVAVVGVVTSFFVGLHPITAAILAGSALTSWLVLRGGRVVWSFMVLAGLMTIAGPAWGEPVWGAAIGALQLALLLAPSSRAYVWRESPRRRESEGSGEVANGLATRAVSGLLWEEIWSWLGSRAVNWRFIGRLALVLLLLVVVDGQLENGRDDGWAAAVVERAFSIATGTALLLLLGLLIATGIRWVTRRLSVET